MATKKTTTLGKRLPKDRATKLRAAKRTLKRATVPTEPTRVVRGTLNVNTRQPKVIKGSAVLEGRRASMKVTTLVLVPVDQAVLKAVAARTGLQDEGAIVDYALHLLADSDPSVEFAMKNLGALRGLDLDI